MNLCSSVLPSTSNLKCTATVDAGNARVPHLAIREKPRTTCNLQRLHALLKQGGSICSFSYLGEDLNSLRIVVIYSLHQLFSNHARGVLRTIMLQCVAICDFKRLHGTCPAAARAMPISATSHVPPLGVVRRGGTKWNHAMRNAVGVRCDV